MKLKNTNKKEKNIDFWKAMRRGKKFLMVLKVEYFQ